MHNCKVTSMPSYHLIMYVRLIELQGNLRNIKYSATYSVLNMYYTTKFSVLSIYY